MLIKKLNATTDAITQAALVSISRERARQAVSKMVCPNKLLSYSARLYRISKEHPAANSLQREAELATQKAIEIRSRKTAVHSLNPTADALLRVDLPKCITDMGAGHLFTSESSKKALAARTFCGCATKTNLS